MSTYIGENKISASKVFVGANTISTIFQGGFQIWPVVVEAPVAIFKQSKVSINMKIESLTLTDNSTGKPTSWHWDFGDGTTSTEQNPVKTYNVNGIYTIELTVTNAAGSDSTTKQQTVRAIANPYIVPNTIPALSGLQSVDAYGVPDPDAVIDYVFWFKYSDNWDIQCTSCINTPATYDTTGISGGSAFLYFRIYGPDGDYGETACGTQIV